MVLVIDGDWWCDLDNCEFSWLTVDCGSSLASFLQLETSGEFNADLGCGIGFFLLGLVTMFDMSLEDDEIGVDVPHEFAAIAGVGI